MAFCRSSIVGLLAVALVLLAAVDVPAAQASPVVLRSGMPCVHRGITFFCGHVPIYGSGPAVTQLQFSYGDPGDLPLFGDWNGDGNRTAAVFRPGSATWYLSNTDNASDVPQQVRYGMPGDIPLAGDWTGTGTQTIGVYRPANATFYLRTTNTSGIADLTMALGNVGDVPLAGDFDHTGTTKIGVYRPANGTFYFTHTTGPVTATPLGNPGDIPLAGSYWCADCACTPVESVFGVFRPSDITWYGLCFSNLMSATLGDFRYGDSRDLPLLK